MELAFPYGFHNHSVYCDGRATPAEMAEAAFAMGMKGFAFTGHLYDRKAAHWSMSREGCIAYRAEIDELKKKYEGRMEIFCGAEADLWTTDDLSSYDLVIGSVHCFKLSDGRFVMTDQKPEDLIDLTDEIYGGDIYSMIEAFFEMEGAVADMKRVDLIGHLDYVSKFSRIRPLFDEDHPRYIGAWHGALDRLIPLGIPFEINTSPFYRGRLDHFYPARPILEEIHRRGGSITITGDCHETSNLYLGYPEAIAMAKDIGFKSAAVFTKEGWKEAPL